MLKELQLADLERLLEDLARGYNLWVPQLLADGSRQLAPYSRADLSMAGKPLQRKPTDRFFPQTELMLSLSPDGAVEAPAPAPQPLALLGLDRRDLAALNFLDRFFSSPPADDIYLRRRSGALVIGLTGLAGEGNSFLPFSGGNCDLELVAEHPQGHWLGRGYSARGKALLAGFKDADPARLKRLSLLTQSEEQETQLELASGLLQADKVPDSFWEEISNQCILCCGCNYACPTCSCFCVQDRTTSTGTTERSRVWDSCQLDAFMREASGHNPLGTEALRTRRRIHHKLVADVERWGEIGCVACGRCDRACPTGIGMLAVTQKIIARYGSNKI
mgnify:CR=1 FL=1